jgi:hypothetical protein
MALCNELTQGIGNISDWGKYSMQSILSPLTGKFKVHFYRNSLTNDIHYTWDYKFVFNHDGAWHKMLPSAKFNYEPPRFIP